MSPHPGGIHVKFFPWLTDVVVRLTEQKSCPGLAQDLTGDHSQSLVWNSVTADTYSSLRLRSSPVNQLHPQVQGDSLSSK